MMKTAALMISSPSIPEEIIFDILLRLPVKILCRFRAVSKQWLSIINSRPFIDTHFERSKLNPTRLFGFYNMDTTTQHPTIFFSTNYPQTSSYNLPDMMDYRKLWLSSISPRGLICFYNDRGDTAIQIWNPSTGEHIEVNDPPRSNLIKRYLLFLGFDPVSKKHKLLSSSDGKNYIFTLGENKWRKIGNTSSNLNYTVRMNCCIDGIVYYLAQRDQNDDELVLVRFDVGSESFLDPIRPPEELVRFPDQNGYYISRGYFSSRIYVYRGTILFLSHDSVRTNEYKMWVLEDVEKQKWSPKRFIPRLPPSPTFYCCDVIDGEELLFYSTEMGGNSEGNFRLCSYDLEKGSGSWTETRFHNFREHLLQELDGSARYDVKLYNFVETLEPLKVIEYY